MPHMYHTHAKSLTLTGNRSVYLRSKNAPKRLVRCELLCYRLLTSGWAARCKIVRFMPSLWKWVNMRMGTRRRSSHTLVTTESSGTAPRERRAKSPPFQSVVMRKMPLLTPSQVQFATRLGVTTSLLSYAFRARERRPSFVGAVTGIQHTQSLKCKLESWLSNGYLF